jgi:phospholipid/cholesterol/gamma-HCH transport system substrate-binding protein
MKAEIAVGIFFLIAMLILGYFTILMTGEIFHKGDIYYMTVLFPNVEGLAMKNKVKINGVDAGIVDEIRLLERDSTVMVKIRMNKRFMLYANYKIMIKSESALGVRYVSINPGSEYRGNQRVGVVITRENLTGDALADPLSLLAEFIEDNRENVNQTIANIKNITAQINSGKGTLGKLISESKLHDSADGMIKELRDAIEDTREQAPVTSFLRAALTAF